MFKRTDGGFAFHGGKVLKELAQSLPAFEVIQERLERDSSPAEYRRPPKDIGVSHDNAVGRCHSRISLSVYPSERRKPREALEDGRSDDSNFRLASNCPLKPKPGLNGFSRLIQECRAWPSDKRATDLASLLHGSFILKSVRFGDDG